jgi:replication factor C large subunit
MVDWTEKYRPATLAEVRGNDKARDALKQWAETWDDHREAVVVHGSPGVGKTSAAHALASDMGWETVELNASDQRTADVIERFAGRAARNATLAGAADRTRAGDVDRGRQLIVLDEADNIHGVTDRGGTQAITDLVKEAAQPMVLIANEFYEMSRGLRNACREIEFRDVSARSIVPVLRDVCRREGVEFEEEALRAIAEANSGDLRSAINDLQAAAEDATRLTVEDVVTGERDRSIGIFQFLDDVLQEQPAREALQSAYAVDETPDDLTKWAEENAPKVYDGAELARAYEYLANADRWLGRVRATQNYSYWRYVSDNVAAGVAAARDSTKGGWTRWSRPQFWPRSDKTADAVVRTVAASAGVSMDTARRELLPYLAAMTHHCKPREVTVAVAAWYDLDESELSFLTGSGETTNKVQSIVEDARQRREDEIEAHASGAFEGTPRVANGDLEGADANGDAGAGPDDGGDDQASLTDAVADDESDDDGSADGEDVLLDENDGDAADDRADAADDDQQSGLSDFF